MVAPPEIPCNASRAESEGRAKKGSKSAAKGIIEAGVLHLASLRGSLILSKI